MPRRSARVPVRPVGRPAAPGWMYLQSGYPVQPTNDPRRPLRRRSGLPHVRAGPEHLRLRRPRLRRRQAGVALDVGAARVARAPDERPAPAPGGSPAASRRSGTARRSPRASLFLRSLMYVHSGNREQPTNSPNLPSRTTRRPISHSGHSSPVSRAGTRTRSIDRSARSSVSANGSYHSRTVGSYSRVPSSTESSRFSRSAVKATSTMLREVLAQHRVDGLAELGRMETALHLLHVLALLDHLDRRGVRRRPADAALLELLDQRRLGESRRRLREVLLGRDLEAFERFAARRVRGSVVSLSLSSSRFQTFWNPSNVTSDPEARNT